MSSILLMLMLRLSHMRLKLDHLRLFFTITDECETYIFLSPFLCIFKA